MEQKDIENLKSKRYITKRGEGNKTIYPLSLLGVKELTKNIAESELVDVEYLTVNSFTDYTREQLKDKKYIQLTNTAELEDIFKVKKGEPVKPKFILCFLNGEKDEYIADYHFLPIILFNGKKYIFDLDLRKIEDSEFVKKIITQTVTQNINNSDFNNAIKDLESLHFIDNIKDNDKKIIDKINTFKTTLNSLFSTNIVNFIQDETKKQTIGDNIKNIKEISKNLNIENFKDTKEKICKLTAEIDKIVLPHIKTKISEANIEIFNVSQAMANGIYTGSIIQADKYNCGTNTVEVAQQIYEHYLKYFHNEEYKKQYCKKHNIESNDYKAKKLFKNYLQKEIKLDGKFVLLSQSSETIDEYFKKKNKVVQDTKQKYPFKIDDTPHIEFEKEVKKFYKKMFILKKIIKELKQEKLLLEKDTTKTSKLLGDINDKMKIYENTLLPSLFNIKAEDIINNSQPKQPNTTLQIRKEHENILKK